MFKRFLKSMLIVVLVVVLVKVLVIFKNCPLGLTRLVGTSPWADCFRFAHPAEAMLWLWHMLFCGLYTCFQFGFRCTLCGKTMPPSYFAFETLHHRKGNRSCVCNLLQWWVPVHRLSQNYALAASARKPRCSQGYVFAYTPSCA